MSRAAQFWRLAVALTSIAVLMVVASPAAAVGDHRDAGNGRADFDARTGNVAPTSEQLSAVSSLGATARWNSFGTPQSLIKHGGYLATGLTGSAGEAARAFLSQNAALFKLSAASVADLELVNDVALTGSDGHAVLFRQRFGGLPAGQDGLINVGVVNGNIAYVSSSSAGDRAAPGAATLSAAEAFVRAAADVGRTVSLVDITAQKLDKDRFTLLTVNGFAQPQRARLVAFPTPEGVRAAYETILLDVEGGDAMAYTSFVDAQTGSILFRRNQVENLAADDVAAFSGAYQEAPAAPACGSYHDFEVTAGTTVIDVTAAATISSNDIVLELHKPQGNELTHSDTATSPEAIHYAPANLEAGTYSVRVCPYPSIHVAPYTYTGTFSTSSAPVNAATADPRWRAFPANPPLDLSDTDTRQTWCYFGGTGCDLVLENLAARAPWDYDVRTGAATRTTKGNAAITGEAWSSPLTPAEQYRPVAADRNYSYPWTDQWQNSGCSPTSFTPRGNDIDAATVNLFGMHNRMHDWSYFLGFTERAYNMQDSNFGLTAPGPYPGRENDPEVGNSQAGAVSGGAPSYTGRDNANQITLNDGIAPITNMYLWQPIAAAFYPPCVDGDYDMSVIGHEYTHAISNRMIGGPDANITGNQGRAMGESWSDLTAVEYLDEYGYVPTDGENPFSVGAYVTGQKETGIRNYAMNRSPLNHSDVGYDFVCNTDTVTGNCTSQGQVHADGEIWSATNFDVRSELIAKYGAGTPQLERDCADGKLPANQCSGNRRWIQILFDAYLLMPASVSMLDARDAYLAADMMRFSGANQTELWRAFAKRGMGEFAATAGSNDDNPTPSFESKTEANEAAVTFAATALDESNAPVKAKIYVGDFEARVTPIADTDGTTALGPSAKFVPGTYSFIAQAPGYGMRRFTLTLAAGAVTSHTVGMQTNLASGSKGAVATGDAGTHLNLQELIDDTEATNWATTGRTPSVSGASVTVDLAGSAPVKIDRVQVSSMLRHRQQTRAQDSGSQSRFSALRQFAIETCASACTTGGSFTRIYESAPDAFPSGVPRPLSPSLNLRGFDVPDTQATHVRLVVLQNQCTGTAVYRGEQDTDPANATDCVDASTRENEVRAAELQVFGRAPAPDLKVTQIVVNNNKSVSEGNKVTVAVTVQNAGNATAGASQTEIRVIAGTPKLLGTIATKELSPGESTTVSVQWDTRSTRGDQTIRATADIANVVAESDETNNTLDKVVTVRGNGV